MTETETFNPSSDDIAAFDGAAREVEARLDFQDEDMFVWGSIDKVYNLYFPMITDEPPWSILRAYFTEGIVLRRESSSRMQHSRAVCLQKLLDMVDEPLENMPLYVASTVGWRQAVCQWRLKIGQ